MRIFLLTVVITCFSFILSIAQPVIKSSVDKNEILIGDQFKLTIEAGFSPDDFKIYFPVIPDSIRHFEVVGSTRLDSLYSNKKLSGIVQTITLTSFDSGKWVLPSFQVTIKPAGGNTPYSFFTDSVPVTVSFSTSDTTSQLRDIKPIREADTMYPVWYWIGAGVILVSLIVFLIWFYRYWKRNKGVSTFPAKHSAFEEAIRELEKLKGSSLTEPGEVKFVHIRLGEILKQYLSHNLRSNQLNKTTGDILILLNEQFSEKNLLAKAASSLRYGDAVKFAKYLPSPAESSECIQSIREIINHLHQQPSIQSERLPDSVIQAETSIRAGIKP